MKDWAGDADPLAVTGNFDALLDRVFCMADGNEAGHFGGDRRRHPAQGIASIGPDRSAGALVFDFVHGLHPMALLNRVSIPSSRQIEKASGERSG